MDHFFTTKCPKCSGIYDTLKGVCTECKYKATADDFALPKQVMPKQDISSIESIGRRLVELLTQALTARQGNFNYDEWADLSRAAISDFKKEANERFKRGCNICQRPFRFQEEADSGVCAVCVINAKKNEKSV